MKAFVFPGQGSQKRGMGENLFNEFPELTSLADEILGYSIADLCIKDSFRQLNKTEYTQPALFVVNALSYLREVEDSLEFPDFVAGHSLGEYNALFAAGAFNFETGLKIVKKRGELMAKAMGGGMAAILNADEEQIRTILSSNGLNGIDLANFNTRSQIVISGVKDEIIKAEALFKSGAIEYYPLNTSGAFHSRYMHAARKEFEIFLNGFTFSPLKFPVISNVGGRPYGEDEVISNLSRQIDHPVRWNETIKYLLNVGVVEFAEIGGSDILTKMINRIKEEEKDTVSPVTRGESPSSSFKAFGLNFNSLVSAQQKVAMWNEKYPVGSKIKSLLLENNLLETRTEAVVLFGHRAAVYVKGLNGYLDLDEVLVANN